MVRKTIIPHTITGFAEYIRNAYEETEKNMDVYKINVAEFAKITPLYTVYNNLEMLCANPDTATRGNRDARNEAWDALEKQWRIFLNREVRLNDNISTAKKEIYGIFPHDNTPTRPAVPKETGKLTVLRQGFCEYDVVVRNESTGRKRRPDDATGSNLYSAVVELGELAPQIDTFRFDGFSPKCHHKKRFAGSQFAKQACLFVRYTNSQGEEGPAGPVAIIQIIS